MTPENGKIAEAQKAPRHRSPNYPGIGLKTAAEKITGWFKNDGHVAAPKDAAIKQMGGDPGRMASALKNFGLVVEENGRIKLTQRGLEIAARPPEDPKRQQALKDAALSPPIYRELVKLYPNGLPSDPTLQSELITEKHFNQHYVNDFIKDFRQTLEFSGISSSVMLESGKDQKKHEEQPPKKEVEVSDYVQWESQGVLQFPEPKRVREISEDDEWAFVEGSNTGVPVKELTVVDPPAPPAPPVPQATTPPRPRTWVEAQQLAGVVPPAVGATRQDVFSLTEGQVTIQWPATLSPESFQDLSSWLDILKRKIGRSVPFRITKRDVIAKLKAGFKIDGDPDSDTPCALVDPAQTNIDSQPMIPADILRELIDDGIVADNPGPGRRLFKLAA